MAADTYTLTLTPRGTVSRGGNDEFDLTGVIAGTPYRNHGTVAVVGSGLWLSVRSFATARGGSPALATGALSAAVKSLSAAK